MSLVAACSFVTLLGQLHVATVKAVGPDGTPDGTQKMTFKPPNVSDEEKHSNFMPEQLKCDACRIVAYQLYINFKQFNKAHKNYKNNLPESEILDIVDGVCNDKETFNTYGIKEVKGVNRLSGAGLETQDAPGMLSGGGKWPGRLMNMCSSFVEELGEEQLYEIYRQDPSDNKAFEKSLCKGNGIFGECVKKQERQRQEL